MDAIILLGGPGAGKGTIAGAIKKKTAYLHVSTGEMLRAAVKSESAVGLAIKSCMKNGELVPDSLVMDIIKERIGQEGAEAHFMFDGFPRTLEQAKRLDSFFKEVGGTITHVLNLEAAPDDLIPRLCGRRTCKTCGAIYHLITKPPHVEGICDIDGGALFQRVDDNEQTVKNRIEVYQTTSAPLFNFYQEKGLVRRVDAGETAENTAAQALAILQGSI